MQIKLEEEEKKQLLQLIKIKSTKVNQFRTQNRDFLSQLNNCDNKSNYKLCDR